MLHCSACIPNSIRTVLSHHCNTFCLLISSPPLLLTRQGTRHSTWLRQSYATEASRPSSAPTNAPALVRLHRTHIAAPIAEAYKKSNLEIELRWLKDPVRLADHTVKLLRDDDFLKALEIVRLASKDVECTVSWNHLIDYEMSKAKVTNAVKLYNEVSSCLVPSFYLPSNLTRAKDEEACTTARCVYLHYTLPRLFLVSTPRAVHRTCSFNIPVYVYREQSRQTVHHPYQRRSESLCSRKRR